VGTINLTFDLSSPARAATNIRRIKPGVESSCGQIFVKAQRQLPPIEAGVGYEDPLKCSFRHPGFAIREEDNYRTATALA